ncbi:MAG: M48 family metallopeptidase [Planctomycetota bacterium]
MDFFGQQDKARRASGLLVWLFLAAVVCIIALIYVAAKLLLFRSQPGDPGGFLDWPLLGAVSGIVTVVVVGATLFKTAQLRGGGGKVATMLGGREVDPSTRDLKERVLLNVVEEMAIASGVPVPEIYVLDNEQAINAFAAGWAPSDAAVAVTRGSLDQFTREELQGVIAHEFSHVFHGDMRLNIRLMGTLFGIVCITVVGRMIMQSAYYSGGHRRSNRDSNGGGVVFFGIALLAIGYVGVLFARMIQAAVSRQREYLADASAVQYTRNPRGIGMALARIGGIGGKLESAHAEEASHMMFAEGVSHMGGGLATHPPLEKRIERVLPGFLSKLQASPSPDMVEAAAATPMPAQFAEAGAAGFAGGAATSQPRSSAAIPASAGMAPDDLVQSVGDPQPEHVVRARQLLQDLPMTLSQAAHEPEGAEAVVYALLLDTDSAERSRQLDLLGSADAGVQMQTRDHAKDVTEMRRELRLPLFELSVPALRRLPEERRRALRQHARKLAMADNHVSPFEFALLQALDRHVRLPEDPVFRRGRPESLTQHAGHARTVLSVIAHAGAPNDPDEAAAAFARGQQALQLPADSIVPASQATARELEPAVAGLAKVSPFGKRNLITACAQVAAHDGRLDPDEVDLVRALAELWDCPVPLATT